MNATHLISHDIIALKTSSTGNEALELMSEYYVQHLPIVNNEQFLGVISEEDILQHDVNEAIGSYHLSLKRPFVRDRDHVFDVLSQVAKLGLTVVPVTDAEENYLGVISQRSLLAFFSTSFSFAERGSIIVLEMSKPDYVLSELARLLESEGVIILGSFISSEADSNQILVHLKTNKQDLHRAIAVLERYEYVVKAMYSEEGDGEILKERFESLMHYLNV